MIPPFLPEFTLINIQKRPGRLSSARAQMPARYHLALYSWARNAATRRFLLHSETELTDDTMDASCRLSPYGGSLWGNPSTYFRSLPVNDFISSNYWNV